MNRAKRFSRALYIELLKRVPYILVVLAILGVIGFVQSYIRTAQAVEIAKQNTTDIKHLVAGQTNLLNAIRKVTNDNNATAKQQTDIIICMLLVPQSERTKDLQQDCRKQVLEPSTAATNTNTSATAHPNNTTNTSQKATSHNSGSGTSKSVPEKVVNFFKTLPGRVRRLL